jgi:hypothetical protein
MSVANIPWGDLIARIERHQLTPFLGAGISRPPMPSACELAKRLARRYDDYRFLDQDLMEVAQYGATTVDNASPKLGVQDIFSEIPDPDFDDLEQPHHILASLPLPIYLTTNYDTYMEKALEEQDRPARSELCRWNKVLQGRGGTDPFSEEAPTAERPIVYHLHGRIDNLDSMVLTEDDYLDFMVNARRFEGPDMSVRVIPPRIDEQLANTSIMFLGYGLKDWNLRVLLRALVGSAERSTQKLSVSVQLEPDDKVVQAVGPERAISYLEKYFDGLRIRVYWGTLENFLHMLKERWASRDHAGIAS